MRFSRRLLRPGEPAAGMGMMGEDGASYEIAIDPDSFDGLVLQRTTEAAGWVAATLWRGTGDFTVASLVPPTFGAYARLPYGTLDSEAPGVLMDVLAAHTSTPDDAWFCLWAGYGGLGSAPPGVELLKASPEHPIREYFLYRGPLASWGEPHQHPLREVFDLVWPDDRAWFLGTDTDIDWGFLGATAACVDGLEQAGLDILRVDAGDPFYDAARDGEV